MTRAPEAHTGGPTNLDEFIDGPHFARQLRERIEDQERVLQATTACLEERNRMVHDLSELNEINRL